MSLAVVGYPADCFRRYYCALLLVESLADGGYAVGRLALQISFLYEISGKHTQKIKIVVAGLCSVVAVYENVVKEVDTVLPVKLIDVVKRIFIY